MSAYATCIHGIPLTAHCGLCGTARKFTTTEPFTPHIPYQMGCICPPGANKDCESPVCPRKNHFNLSGVSDK